MERFTITRVSNKELPSNKFRTEVAINVGELNNIRRNSRTVPTMGESRKFSLAQLTRWGQDGGVRMFRNINFLE